MQSPITNTGPAVRLVSVIGFLPSDNAALCRDEFGKEYEVPMGIERTSRRPVIGEQWLIDSSFGNWSFAGWLAATRQPSPAGAGSIQLFAEAALPDTHLPCDGAEVSRSDYPALYEAIGDSFGTPEESAEAIAIEASQGFALQGSALTGSELAATEDGFTGFSFATPSTMTFASGDTDVLVIVTRATGVKLRSVGGTPPLWSIYDERECLRMVDSEGLTLFFLVARRNTLVDSTAEFILDFPAGTPESQRVVAGQRHRISGIAESALVAQLLRGRPQRFAAEQRSSRASTTTMWVDTLTGNLSNSWNLVVFAHDNYATSSPALEVAPPMSPVVGNSSLTLAEGFGLNVGLRLDSYQTSLEDDQPTSRRRFTAATGWDEASSGHNWVAVALVAQEAESVRKRFILPDMTPPMTGTVYAISTGL